MKRLLFLLFCLGQIVVLTGCRTEKKEEGKKDLEFQIVSGKEIPEEMQRQIEAQKEEPFWITYGDQESLYAGRGYGRKETSGCSVCVDTCCEGGELIYIHTSLIGPDQDAEESEDRSEPSDTPYVVVKMKWSRKQIVFQGK